MKDTDVGRIYVGTSGWSYNHWKYLFYPSGLPSAKWLAFYANHFRSVEINSSFYRLPSQRTLIEWANSVPNSFLFAVKASRYITHMKKLSDPESSTETFLRCFSALGDRLGPILFQLPPHWRASIERLDRFLRTLSRDFRYVFEFRDRSWINDDVVSLLTRYHAAFCVYDLNGLLSPKVVTADFAYVRLHGPDGPYRGNYSCTVLEDWAKTLSLWASEGREVFCYFDNDQLAYAARNAMQLQSLMKLESSGSDLH